MIWLDPLNHPAHSPSADQSLWPAGSSVRTKFGVRVLWWPRKSGGFHLSESELEPYRALGDDLLDDILRLLEKENTALGPTDDLLQLAERAKKTESSKRTPAQTAIVRFIETYSSLPDWVDVDQLRRGQEVFLAYTPVASLSLYYRSLVAGFSIPKIAAVIRATAYLAPPSRPDQALQRLLDTGELTAACMGLGLDSIMPGNLGWKTAIHVRVLHAKVRHALLRRRGARKWDKKKYGVPINQEDMSATLLAFSVNVLDGIDIISGSALSEQERLDYLALWRYIGWLLGVETAGEIRSELSPSMIELPPLDPCGPGLGKRPNPNKNSVALLHSIIFHLLDPDETSKEVSHHLLKITDRKPPSLKMSEIPDEFYRNDLFYYRAFQCRQLIGDPLADALELPVHPNRWTRIKHRMKSVFFMTLFRYYTLASMWIPFVRKRVIQWHSKGLEKFHDEWMKTHQSKMARALTKKEKATCISEDDKSTGTSKEEEVVQVSQTLCPFAMVAPPQ